MSEVQTEKNTSGHGKMTDIPKEIRGWSWGAFLLTWVWGVGNDTYRAFWCLVPIVNIFMWIALGLKGREWAWCNRHWESVEEFKKAQKGWGIAGLIIAIGTILLYVVVFAGVFGAVFSTLNHSTPTKMTVQYVQQNSQMQAVLGSKIKRAGMAQGNIKSSDGTGTAEMHFPISGSKGSGVVSYEACEVQGSWYLSRIDYTDNSDSDNNLQLQTQDSSQCDNSIS